jgi:hypothetical protein
VTVESTAAAANVGRCVHTVNSNAIVVQHPYRTSLSLKPYGSKPDMKKSGNKKKSKAVPLHALEALGGEEV